MVIVTVTDIVTDRRAVSQSAGEEGRGAREGRAVLGHRRPCAFMGQCGSCLDSRV